MRLQRRLYGIYTACNDSLQLHLRNSTTTTTTFKAEDFIESLDHHYEEFQVVFTFSFFLGYPCITPIKRVIQLPTQFIKNINYETSFFRL